MSSLPSNAGQKKQVKSTLNGRASGKSTTNNATSSSSNNKVKVVITGKVSGSMIDINSSMTRADLEEELWKKCKTDFETSLNKNYSHIKPEEYREKVHLQFVSGGYSIFYKDTDILITPLPKIIGVIAYIDGENIHGFKEKELPAQLEKTPEAHKNIPLEKPSVLKDEPPKEPPISNSVIEKSEILPKVDETKQNQEQTDEEQISAIKAEQRIVSDEDEFDQNNFENDQPEFVEQTLPTKAISNETSDENKIHIISEEYLQEEQTEKEPPLPTTVPQDSISDNNAINQNNDSILQQEQTEEEQLSSIKVSQNIISDEEDNNALISNPEIDNSDSEDKMDFDDHLATIDTSNSVTTNENKNDEIHLDSQPKTQKTIENSNKYTESAKSESKTTNTKTFQIEFKYNSSQLKEEIPEDYTLLSAQKFLLDKYPNRFKTKSIYFVANGIKLPPETIIFNYRTSTIWIKDCYKIKYTLNLNNEKRISHQVDVRLNESLYDGFLHVSDMLGIYLSSYRIKNLQDADKCKPLSSFSQDDLKKFMECDVLTSASRSVLSTFVFSISGCVNCNIKIKSNKTVKDLIEEIQNRFKLGQLSFYLNDRSLREDQKLSDIIYESNNLKCNKI